MEWKNSVEEGVWKDTHYPERHILSIQTTVIVLKLRKRCEYSAWNTWWRQACDFSPGQIQNRSRTVEGAVMWQRGKLKQLQKNCFAHFFHGKQRDRKGRGRKTVGQITTGGQRDTWQWVWDENGNRGVVVNGKRTIWIQTRWAEGSQTHVQEHERSKSNTAQTTSQHTT